MKEKFVKIKWEAVITVIISLTGIFVTVKANKIYNLQAEIAKYSAFPTIEIDELIEGNSELGLKESVIEISNLSGKMNNYQAALVSFLHCEYFDDELMIFKNIDIPIVGYYIVGIREGVTIGIIEKKHTMDNYSKIENLKNSIIQYNKKNENEQYINTKVDSYLKISYLDLLNEKQIFYYSIDPVSVAMIDLQLGEEQFDKHQKLIEEGFFINPNKVDEISISEILDDIEKFLNIENNILVDRNINMEMKTEMNILNEPVISILIGIFFGIIASVFSGWLVFQYENINREKLAASILYNDLKSIEQYLKCEKNSVNLRYSNNWQEIVARCPFLNFNEVTWIYFVYNRTYNYNYQYQLKEKMGVVRKEDINSYIELQKTLFDTSKEHIDQSEISEEYEGVLKKLQKYIK